MSIGIVCPECGSEFQVSAEMAGRKGKCRRCGGILVVPTPGPDGDGDPEELPFEKEADATTEADNNDSEIEDEWDQIDDDSDNYSFNSVYETGQSVVSDDQPRPTALRRPSTETRKGRSRFLGASTSLASEFFDFRWMVTPKLVRGLFMLLTILTLLGLPIGIIYGYVNMGDEMPWWGMILWPFAAIIITALQFLLYRVIFEAVMLPFMVHDALEDIRDAS